MKCERCGQNHDGMSDWRDCVRAAFDRITELEQRLAAAEAAMARVALSETGDKCWSDFAQDFLGWKSTSELWDIIKAAKGWRDE